MQQLSPQPLTSHGRVHGKYEDLLALQPEVAAQAVALPEQVERLRRSVRLEQLSFQRLQAPGTAGVGLKTLVEGQPGAFILAFPERLEVETLRP